MARIRTIKPEFCVSEQLAECSTNARLTFALMWMFCDDNGVHPAKYKTLKAQCYPLDEATMVVAKTLLDYRQWRFEQKGSLETIRIVLRDESTRSTYDRALDDAFRSNES